MSVLSRVNLQSQQRIDLSHLSGMDSFNAADFRMFQKILGGQDVNYVIRGLEIVSVSGLQVTIGVANSIVLANLDNVASFYVASPSESATVLTISSGVTNAYIEATLTRVTGTKVNTAFWDPSSPSNTNSAGSEFLSPSDFQEYVQLNFSVNTTGFTGSAIKIAIVSSNSSQVTTITPAREMFFRLGTGGAIANPDYNYPWSATRSEPVITGNASAIGTSSPLNPYYKSDGVGSVNDYDITSLKQWMNAVMSQIKAMNGTPYWYSSIARGTSGSAINSSALFYNDGDQRVSILGADQGLVRWSSGTANTLSGTTGTPTKWVFTFGKVTVNLADAYTAGTRAYPATPAAFVSPVVPDGYSLFLKLRREYLPSTVNNASTGGSVVNFATLPITGQTQARCVVGSAGDFTGIAVGDYIRRISGGFYDYVQIVSIVTGASTGTPTVVSTAGTIAGSTVDGLVVASDYTVANTSKFLTMVSNHISTDLYISSGSRLYTVTNSVGDTVSMHNMDLVLIGTRVGTGFILKDFGTLLPNCTSDRSTSYVDATSNTGAAWTVNHGFLNPTVNFTWQAMNMTNPAAPTPVALVMTSMSSTGITFASFSPATPVRILFQRIG
jgi:hypothetical protein